MMQQRPFKRLAIVNRGEAAMRAIRAVRELNWERAEAIEIIAYYTERERHALFVREADERYCIGPAKRDAGEEQRPAGYLDYAALEHALTETRAGITLPSYRGDIINRIAFTEQDRTPEPELLVRGYDRALSEILTELAGELAARKLR